MSGDDLGDLSEMDRLHAETKLRAEIARLRRGRNIWREWANRAEFDRARAEATIARVREALDKPFNATFDGLFEHYQNICAAIEGADS